MHCPRHGAIPELLIVCPACATERGLKCVEEYQYEFLRLVREGDLAVRSPKLEGVQHLQQFGDGKRTFCGITFSHATGRLYLKPAMIGDQICPGCRAEMERLTVLALEPADPTPSRPDPGPIRSDPQAGDDAA
jgi:hypothetical protein